MIHVHLYENGKFEDIEGDIKDCASRWCQIKHGRDSVGGHALLAERSPSPTDSADFIAGFNSGYNRCKKFCEYIHREHARLDTIEVPALTAQLREANAKISAYEQLKQ